MKHTPYLYAHAITHGGFHGDQHMVCFFCSTWCVHGVIWCGWNVGQTSSVWPMLWTGSRLYWCCSDRLMSYGAHQHISQLNKVVHCVLPYYHCAILYIYMYVQYGCDLWALSLYLALVENDTPILWVKVMYLNFDRSKCIRISTHAAELLPSTEVYHYITISSG